MPEGRKPRQNDFFFSPRDYLRDPAIVAMRCRLDARGAYSTMLLELWDQDEPGVAPDDDAVLAGLAWATPEEWAKVRALVARAFDTTSRPGFWVQKRMVREYRRQSEYHRERSNSGKRGSDKRWGGRELDSSAIAQLSPSNSAFQPFSLSAVSEPTLSSPSGEVRAVRKGWRESFHAVFWPEYPNKVGKQASIAEWMRLCPANGTTPEAMLATIMAGLARSKASDRWRRGYVKDPERWLKHRRWEDESSTTSQDDEATIARKEFDAW